MFIVCNIILYHNAEWLILDNHEFGYYVTIIMHLHVFQVICQLIELSQCLMFAVLLYYFQMSFSISYCVYYLCLCSHQSSSSSGTINKIRTSCVVFSWTHWHASQHTVAVIFRYGLDLILMLNIRQ